MPSFVSNVSAFVIRDLSGPASVIRHELVLSGRGLPLRPLTLVTAQRLNLTWLAGYSQATGQPLGPTENVTTLRGKWSDKWLSESLDEAESLGPLGNTFAGIDNTLSAAAGSVGLGSNIPSSDNLTIPVLYRNQRVSSAYAAAEIVDELVRGGVYVEVRWDRHARRGYLTKFSKDWPNARDLEWELECTWTSRAEPSLPASLSQEFGMGDTVSLFQQLADTLNTEALPPTFPMANDVLADVNAGIKRIAATTQAMFDTLANIEALVVAPFGVARNFIALLGTLRGQADELRNRIRASPAPSLRTNKAAASPALLVQTGTKPVVLRSENAASFSQGTVAAEYVWRVGGVLKAISRNATIQQSDYQKKIEQQSEAVIMTREGDNLRDISTRFYGVPDQWRRIALVNGLTAGSLSAGMVLAIPRLDDGDMC